MAKGLGTTLLLSLVTAVGSMVLGTALGIALAGRYRSTRKIIRGYVELWRGLPIIVILFFVFFTLPAVGLVFSPFVAASVGLVLWGSAVMADNVRGAIESIARSQIEGARALALRPAQIMWLIVLPQAFKRLIPPTINLLASLIHATSLSAMLGAFELLESAQRSVQRLLMQEGDSHSFAILGSVMIIFFVICYPLIALSRWLERRLVT
jgi:polar amino acid transport system permease protein